MTGLAGAAALGWLYDSSSFLARTARGALGDARRDPVRLTPADLSKWWDSSLDVLWAGHATVLVNLFGVHVLTDPVFFDWVGAQIGIATLGRKRLVSCALDSERLPRIDLVLLSHAHMDHLDIPSLKRIPSCAHLVTAPRTTDIVSDLGFSSVDELRWDEAKVISTASGDVKITALEVKHWGARWRSDSYRGYVGYLLERGGKKVLFGGDTAHTEAFKRLKQKRGIDVAVMPVGSYGSGSGNHCTPEEAVRMADDCGAKYVVPIHHSTFPIGREPLHEPLERLQHALAADRLALQSPGQSWTAPA